MNTNTIISQDSRGLSHEGTITITSRHYLCLPCKAMELPLCDSPRIHLIQERLFAPAATSAPLRRRIKAPIPLLIRSPIIDYGLFRAYALPQSCNHIVYSHGSSPSSLACPSVISTVSFLILSSIYPGTSTCMTTS